MKEFLIGILILSLIGLWVCSKLSQKLVKIGKKVGSPGMNSVGLKPMIVTAVLVAILVYLYSLYVKY